MHPTVRRLTTAGVIAAVIMAGMLATAARPNRRGQDPEQDRRRVEALRSGGLRAAAALNGSYVDVVSPSIDNEPSSLRDLVGDSSLIVVGRILNNSAALDKSGKRVLTDYEVQVERALKGKPHPSGLITVTMIGGRVSFAGGTWAQTVVGGAPQPVNGDRLLFFLAPTRLRVDEEHRKLAHPGAETERQKQDPTDPRGVNYSTVRGVFGYYPLRADGVFPLSPRKHPLRSKYEAKAESVLLSDVIGAIREERVKP